MTNDDASGDVAALLTRGSLLARNTLWSGLGQVLPMAAALVAIPVLVRGLGTDRFGLLTITWTVIGYFSLLDLGLGRSLTQVIAERLGRGRTEELPEIVWTSILLILGLGVIGGIAVALAAPWLTRHALHVPPGLGDEAIRTFRWLAFSLPAVLGTAGLGGVLSAYQGFGTLNALRIPLSVLSFVAPLALLPFTHDLSAVVAVIAAVRVAGCIAHAWACARRMPALRGAPRWRTVLVRPLFRSGGWIAVINALGPFLLGLDRLLLGAWGTMTEVTWYATPQEAASKLWFIPGPLVVVLFPAFATSHEVDRPRLRLLYARGLKFLYCSLLPITVVLVALAPDVLRVWLGAAFASHSRLVLQVLVVGAFVSGLAYMPSALVQAIGHARRAALLMLAELPLYVLLLAAAFRLGGIETIALAWLLRAVVDFLGCMVLAGLSLGDVGGTLARLVAPALGTAGAIAAAFLLVRVPLPLRVAILAVVLAAYATWAWRLGFAAERKALLARR